MGIYVDSRCYRCRQCGKTLYKHLPNADERRLQLLVEVDPQLVAQLDTNDITLLGMAIAKARLGVDPAQVTGVVVSAR